MRRGVSKLGKLYFVVAFLLTVLVWTSFRMSGNVFEHAGDRTITLAAVSNVTARIPGETYGRPGESDADSAMHRLPPLQDFSGIRSTPNSWKASTAIDDASRRRVIQTYAKSPLSFEANQGQTDSRVKFLSRGPGYTMFLTSDEAVLRLTQSGDKPVPRVIDAHATGFAPPAANARTLAREAIVRMKLVGARPNPKVLGQDELPGKVNYFLGNDPSKWRANVPTYARVHYEGVYPGIDVVYYGNQRQLEYDFVVQPGAEVEA